MLNKSHAPTERVYAKRNNVRLSLADKKCNDDKHKTGIFVKSYRVNNVLS